MLGVWLWPRDDKPQQVFLPAWRPFDSSADKLTDEFPGGIVAFEDLRRAPNPESQQQRRVRFAGMSGTHDDIVNREGRSLLKRNAYYATPLSKFGSTVSREQMSKVLNGHLPLEGHTAASRRIGARALTRQRYAAAACFGVSYVL